MARMAKAVKPYEKRLRVRGRLSFNPRLTIHFKWLTILCRGCKLLGKFVAKQVQVCWNRECHAGFSQPQGNVKDVVVATLPQVSGWVDYVAGLIQAENWALQLCTRRLTPPERAILAWTKHRGRWVRFLSSLLMITYRKRFNGSLCRNEANGTSCSLYPCVIHMFHGLHT